MALYLIRHPEPQVDAGLCYGRSDIPLREPVDLVLALLQSQLPDRYLLYSSPLQRCALLAQALPATPQFDERLQEMNFGMWELTPWENIGAAKMDAWISSGFAAEAHGGESYRQFQSRILSWLNELPVAEDKVVVTHAGVIRVLLGHFNAWPVEQSLQYPLAFASVTVLPEDLEQS